MDEIKFAQTVYYIQSYCMNPHSIFKNKYSKRVMNDRIVNFDNEKVFLWIENNFRPRSEIFTKREDAEKNLDETPWSFNRKGERHG